jgi:hypothetical protein
VVTSVKILPEIQHKTLTSLASQLGSGFAANFGCLSFKDAALPCKHCPDALIQRSLKS